jgi:hypothetical protein
MRETWEQVEQWRKRADDLRRLAERFEVPSASDTLRDTALYYDRLADELAERLEQSSDRQQAG